MRIAVTGSSGRVGRGVVAAALAEGHSVVGLDRVAPPAGQTGLTFVQTGLDDYDALVQAFRGCDTLIHLAAIPAPIGFPDYVVHNNNVVGSYNALRAGIEVGMTRLCQASSVNALGLSFSRQGHFDYFPLDEQHPSYTEDPYALSKWICEAQAESLVRRYENVTIASLRFHGVLPDRAAAAPPPGTDLGGGQALNLWAYTRLDAAARACLLSLTVPLRGAEAFYIVAPDTIVEPPSLEMAQRYYPQVPVRGDLSGHNSFFSSAKAERMLGWQHPREVA